MHSGFLQYTLNPSHLITIHTQPFPSHYNTRLTLPLSFHLMNSAPDHHSRNKITKIWVHFVFCDYFYWPSFPNLASCIYSKETFSSEHDKNGMNIRFVFEIVNIRTYSRYSIQNLEIRSYITYILFKYFPGQSFNF